MKKVVKKIKYPYPYKSEEEAKANESDIDSTFIDSSWYTDKGTKVTIERKRITNKLKGKRVYKLTLKEEVYIIDDGKNKTLSERFELYPISQMKNLESFRVVVNKIDDKMYISIPVLGNKSFLLDKKRLILFESILEAKGYIQTHILKQKVEYKNNESVRSVIKNMNSRIYNVLKIRKLISGDQRQGYTISEKFRIEQRNSQEN